MNAKTPIRIALARALLALLAGLAASPLGSAGTPDPGKPTVGVVLPQTHLEQGTDAAELLRQSVMNPLRVQGIEPVALTGSSAARVAVVAEP